MGRSRACQDKGCCRAETNPQGVWQHMLSMARNQKKTRRKPRGPGDRWADRHSREPEIEDLSDRELLQRMQRWRQRELDAREQVNRFVRVARERDLSWVDVGRALGLSRQGARQRFGLRSE